MAATSTSLVPRRATRTRVVNRRAKGAQYDVYVGRPSPFGNPFSHEPSTLAKYRVKTRGEAIAKFEEWARSQPDFIARIKRELRGKVLGCWCVPMPCHAEILARIADEDAEPAPLALRDTYDPRDYGARCDVCPLKDRHRPVPPTYAAGGIDKTRLVVLGEGPGRIEIHQGTPFCFIPKTLVLMGNLTWRPLGKVQVGDEVIALDEHAGASTGASGRSARKWQIAKVTATHRRVAHCIEVKTMHGVLIGTPDHKVLTSYPKIHGSLTGGAKHWLEMSRLACGPERAAHIMSIGPVWAPANTYGAGWLAGFLDGEGSISGSKSQRVRRAGRVGFSQNTGPVLNHARAELDALGFKYLAAERIRTKYKTDKTCVNVYVAGGFLEWMRLIGVVRPQRLLQDFCSVISRVSSRNLLRSRVIEKNKIEGEREVVDITTTAGTFVANGFIVHNCGPSGKLLDSMLEKAEFKRSDAHITNAAACRGDTDWEKDRAAACCSERLARELAAIPPHAPILTLGAPAMKVMLGRSSILKVRGFIWKIPIVEDTKLKTSVKRLDKRYAKLKDSPKDDTLRDSVHRAEDSLWRLQGRAQLGGRVVIPTIHPAFILRGGDGWLPVLKVDVARAVRWSKKPFKLYDDGPFETAKTVKELERLIKRLRTKEIVIDVETDGTDPLTTKMLMLGLSEVPDWAVGMAPVGIGPDDIRIVLASPWVKGMAPILNKFFLTHTAVGHNVIHFDEVVLEKHGVRLREEPLVSVARLALGQPVRRVEDSLIAHHAYASHLRQGLDHVVSVYCDSGPWKIEFKSAGAEEKGIPTFSMLNKGNLDRYNAADVRLNAIAWRRMQADLEPERHLYEHDLQLSRVCQQMQVVGFKIDTERQHELSMRMRGRYAALLGEMRRLAGSSFHPSRAHDLRKVIFGRFNVPAIKATPTGLACTDSSVLEVMRTQDTRAGHLSDLVLRGRATAKMKSTYVDGLHVGADGRTHTQWKAFGTPNGRFSGKIQTLPRLEWTDKAKKLFKKGMKPKEVKALLGYEAYEMEARIREMYVAEDGWELNYFDLRQSEMRMAAYVSNDEAFITSCESGDVHSANACILFPYAADDIRNDKEGRGAQWRSITKNAAFGIIYLAEIQTIFQFLHARGFKKVAMADVEAAFSTIYKTYTRYYQYCTERLEECRRNGFLRTVFTGRRRFLSFYPKPSDVANFTVQSGIADLMNLRMLEMLPKMPRLRHGKPQARLVAQVHDALILECRKGAPSQEVQALIKETWSKEIVMPGTGRRWIMPIDQKTAERWSDLG